MQVVVRNLESALEKRRDDVFVVYHRPLHRTVWDASPEFRLLTSTTRYLVYARAAMSVTQS
jgi:hypothetical protein